MPEAFHDSRRRFPRTEFGAVQIETPIVDIPLAPYQIAFVADHRTGAPIHLASTPDQFNGATDHISSATDRKKIAADDFKTPPIGFAATHVGNERNLIFSVTGSDRIAAVMTRARVDLMHAAADSIRASAAFERDSRRSHAEEAPTDDW